MTTPNQPLQAGDTLGDYQLLLPIGQGGMGRVWVAREKASGPIPRWVAIKTALAESAPNKQFWTALLDEAHIASSLRHPNVCVIHAVETEGTIVYLVMDWSDGGSLRELLDAAPNEKIAPPLAARIVAGVCAGLHAAHELKDEQGASLGVVHRDVSPQNILFSTSGQVKLADFGVAKARGQLQEATRTGELKGKLSYMAPEQVTLKPFDRRADIFALGCVLYEATLGKRPFHGNDALATLYSLLEQPLTPPTQIDPSYPPGLEAIVMKALAREPGDRYQTAEELGYALESWMTATRVIVTENSIALLLKTTMGERIQERRDALQEIVRKLDAGEAVSEAMAADDSRAPTQLGMSTQAAVVALAPQRRGAFLAATAGIVALVALGSLWFLGGSDKAAAEGVPAPIPSPVQSAAAPEAPALVTVTIRTTPVAGRISVDGASAQPSPLVLQVPKSDQSRRLVAMADGYRDEAALVTFDADREIELKLTPQPRARAASPRAGTKPQTAAASNPTPAPRGPGELPPVVERAPRSLDSDNPFASKP